MWGLRPFYIRETEWYSFYRHGVFTAIRDAKNRGAERIALIGVRPDSQAKRTCMEFPAIMEDLLFAHRKKYAPFTEQGKENINWNSMCELRVNIDMLKTVLETHSKDGFTPLVISCSEHDRQQAEGIIQEHNKTASQRELAQTGTFWATKEDCYAKGLEYDSTPPKKVMWGMLIVVALLCGLWLVGMTWVVFRERSQMVSAGNAVQGETTEVCKSESEAPTVYKAEQMMLAFQKEIASLKLINAEAENIAAAKQRLEESQQQIAAEAERIAAEKQSLKESQLTAEQISAAKQSLEESQQIIAEQTVQLQACKDTAIHLEDLQSNFTAGNGLMQRFGACSEAICFVSRLWTGCHAVLQHLHLCAPDDHRSQPTQNWTQYLKLCRQIVLVLVLVFFGAAFICFALGFIWFILVKCAAFALGGILAA